MLNVCLIGAGGVGTIAAYVLEKSQRCRVTAVLRSNYAVVKEQGFDIDSVDHGEVRGWKPHRGKPSADNTEGGLAFYHSKVSLRVPFLTIRETIYLAVPCHWHHPVPSFSCAPPSYQTLLASSLICLFLLPSQVIPSLHHATTDQEQPYDFIVITTKAIPELMASLIPSLKPLIAPRKTSLVLIQNGLDIEKPLASAFPETPILSGLSMIGSRTTSPRTVFHEDPDQLRIGPYWHHVGDPLPRATQLDAALLFVQVYNAGLGSGLGLSEAEAEAKTTTRKSSSRAEAEAECVLVDDIIAARWRKLLWNGSFNTICAVLRMSVGQVLSSPGRKTLLEPAMREIAAIGKAAGYADAVSEDVVQFLLHDTPKTSPFRPSMLVHLEKGQPLELDVILGAPLSVAKEKGVSTPVLSQVYELLKVVQWHLLRQTHGGNEPTNGGDRP